jgi:hypothetical protein
MAHPLYGVGLKDQAPLLLVIAPTGTDGLARVVYTDVTGRIVGGGAKTALRPVFSRATTVGVGYSTLTPDKLTPFAATSSFEGRHTYGTPPTMGESSADYPMDERDAIGIRVRLPQGSEVLIHDSCHWGVQADATGDWNWDVNVHFEEI